MKFVIFLCFTTALLGADVPGADLPVHIRNFGKVDGHVYRGAEPTAEGLQDLARLHVGLDIDLRGTGPGTQREKTIAESLGMTYLNVPLPELSAPSGEDVKKVLMLLTAKDSGPIFVHCRRGKDRTGTIIACYRIEEDKWSNATAQQEANQYGMSRIERGMRQFIYDFKPPLVDTPIALK